MLGRWVGKLKLLGRCMPPQISKRPFDMQIFVSSSAGTVGIFNRTERPARSPRWNRGRSPGQTMYLLVEYSIGCLLGHMRRVTVLVVFWAWPGRRRSMGPIMFAGINQEGIALNGESVFGN